VLEALQLVPTPLHPHRLAQRGAHPGSHCSGCPAAPASRRGPVERLAQLFLLRGGQHRLGTPGGRVLAIALAGRTLRVGAVDQVPNPVARRAGDLGDRSRCVPHGEQPQDLPPAPLTWFFGRSVALLQLGGGVMRPKTKTGSYAFIVLPERGQQAPRLQPGEDGPPCAGQVRRPGQARRLGPRAAHHPPAVARRSALSRCRGATPQRRVDGGVVRSQWGCVGVSRARPARHATSRGAGPALRRRTCWGAMCVLRAAPAWMRERVKAIRRPCHTGPPPATTS